MEISDQPLQLMRLDILVKVAGRKQDLQHDFDEDFVTVNPYLGSDGMHPFMEVCKEEKKGMFILS